MLSVCRSATISSDFETNSRFIHINLLNSILKLLSFSIPTDKIDIILPRNLKNVITNTLLDSSISRLFPGIHNTILELVKVNIRLNLTMNKIIMF